MRWIAGLFALLATPAFAANPLCALPSATPMSGDAASPQKAAVASVTSVPADTGPIATLPAGLAGLPFVKHVASAGANVTELAAVHGLHMIAATSSDQFMLFVVTPDGDAAVSGVPIDLTLAQLQSVAAGDITDIGEGHGLHGYFVRSGAHFQVFYATPDGSGLIPGVMWDASGKDLTRQQVSAIPGAIPTVEVGSVGNQQVAAEQALPLLDKAT